MADQVIRFTDMNTLLHAGYILSLAQLSHKAYLLKQIDSIILVLTIFHRAMNDGKFIKSTES